MTSDELKNGINADIVWKQPDEGQSQVSTFTIETNSDLICDLQSACNYGVAFHLHKGSTSSYASFCDAIDCYRDSHIHLSRRCYTTLLLCKV